MEMQCSSSDKSKFYISALLLAVGFGIIFQLTPLYADDLWYLQDSTGLPGSAEYFFTTLNTCINHLSFDVGRLSNIWSAPFLALFPRIVFSMLSALWVFVVIILGQKIIGFTPIGLRSAAWIFSIVAIFPWVDHMFSVIYALNYLWAIGFGISWIYFLTKAPRSVLKIVALFVLSVITGWWHEGMSAPLICGALTYFCINWIRQKRMPARCQTVMLIGLAVGLLINFSMPAFWQMTESRQSNIVKSVWWETLMNVFAFDFAYYIFIGVAIFILAIKGLRRRLLSHPNAMALTCAIAVYGTLCTILYILFYNGPRTGAFAQMACIGGLLWISEVFRIRIPRWGEIAAFILILIFSCASLISAIVIQKKLSKEYEDVTNLYRISKGDVFYDQTPIKIGIDMLKPSYMALNTEYGLRGINLLPKRLEGFSPLSADTKISRDGKFMIYHNCIVCEDRSLEDRIDVNIIDETGEIIKSRTRSRRFKGADGKSYVFLLPHAQTIGGNLQIADVTLESNDK